jgi:surface carbohydrate biosynthesis protein (TIGR04326 family)
MSQKKILIWDVFKEIPNSSDYDLIILWKSVLKQDKVISIPQFIEKHDKELREKYLDYIHKLGKSKYRNHTIIDALGLSDKTSFWWMTNLVEKCNYNKSVHIVEVIRLFALEKILIREPFYELIIKTSNQKLINVISRYSKDNQINFHSELVKPPIVHNKESKLTWLKKKIPFLLKTIVWFIKYLKQNYRNNDDLIQDWKRSESKHLFVSYFANLNLNEIEKGHFKSAYWPKLPDKLIEKEIPNKWLHLRVKGIQWRKFTEIRSALKSLNDNNDPIQTHILLECFLNKKVVVNSLKDWLKIIFKLKKLTRVLAKVKYNSFELFSLHKNDWKESTIGPTGLSNIIYYHLFKEAIGDFIDDETCFYLQENQTWEFALLSAWKKNKKSDIIGVPHSTIRFWDLRYFFSELSFNDIPKYRVPYPDKLAINGTLEKKVILEQSPSLQEKLVDVEALRFMHLLNKPLKQSRSIVFKILVLGEYSEVNTLKQINLLMRAREKFTFKYDITIKSHPLYLVEKSKLLNNYSLRFSMEDLDKLIPNYDVAYVSNVTSAAIDVFYKGLPVISFFDTSNLNLSPLRDIDGAIFVTTVEELLDNLTEIYFERTIINKEVSLFNLNADLKMWLNIIQPD